jgi:Ran GTPase-activating protein (RanGAP) involved in mRNA processing and transport
VTTLYLGGNVIGDQGAQYLSDVLQQNTVKLCTLDLQSNRICTPGIQALAAALRNNTVLEISYFYLAFTFIIQQRH